jgi:transposase
VARRALADAQKRADEQHSTMLWVDESAFYLLPLAARTWAPKGQTPTLRVPLSWDHLSGISGITLDGRLFLHLQEHAYHAEGVVAFLQAVLDQVEGHLPVIWDGAPIHRSHVVKDFLRAGAAKRLHLERLPSYAPDLNPDEGIWNYLKRVALANVCCHALAELTAQVRHADQRLRDTPNIIRACSQQCDYSV